MHRPIPMVNGASRCRQAPTAQVIIDYNNKGQGQGVATRPLHSPVMLFGIQLYFDRAFTSAKWYPRPELNGNQRFRKPLLYPFELRGQNCPTKIGHYRCFSSLSPGDCGDALSVFTAFRSKITLKLNPFSVILLL